MSIFECRQKWKKFQLTTHPKFGSPLFKVSMETEHLHQHYEKWKKWLSICRILHTENFQLMPQRFRSPFFFSVNRNAKLASSIMTKMEKKLQMLMKIKKFCNASVFNIQAF